MWTLVLLAALSMNSAAITTVPGFTSRDRCLAAAQQAKDAPAGWMTVRAFCVEVK